MSRLQARSRIRFLTAALVAVGATSAGAQSAPPPSPTTLTPHQRAAREIYRQLIEINTVDSVGSVTKAAQAMAARFRAAGFPARDVQVLIPAGKPTKGNLVVRYRGRGNSTRKPLLLLAHLDVVAANRADWPRDPFVLHEENGYFLGRGTSDDKAMAAIFAANLLQMKQQGIVPDRDIILALTADEENGDANGAEWLAKDHKDLIDAAYALNEGGGGALANGKPIYQSIQAAEKVYADFTITATNPGGHSSVPRPDNAIYELAQALLRISHYQFPVALNDVTRPFLEQSATVEPRPEMAAAMRALATNPADSAAAATLSTDPRFASMLRTSCVATRLSGGHAYNALPQRATANINCRIAPTSSFEETRDALVRAIADTGIHIDFTITATNPGGHSSVPRPDNAIYELAQALLRISHYQFPVALNDVTRPFLEQSATVEPRPEMAAAMRALATNPADSAAAATLSTDPRFASMLRTSCVATRLSGGHAYNALPQRATANINCRIAPTSSFEETRDALVRAIADTGIHIDFTIPPTGKFGAKVTPVDPELLAAATDLTKQMWGNIPVIPTMSTGATDGKYMRAVGIPTFGISGLFSEPGENNAHGRDEKLRVKSFYEGLAFLDQLVRRLSGVPAA